jgi:hypothetical protein
VSDVKNEGLDSVRVAILDNESQQALEEVFTKADGSFGKIRVEAGKSYTLVTDKKVTLSSVSLLP